MSKQKQSFKWSIFKKIISYSFLAYMIWFLIKMSFTYTILKKYGHCKKSVLTKEIRYFRSHKPALSYNFWLNGKLYDGNSNVEDLSQVGDSICVVYLEWMPSINRPSSFFDDQMNCTCK